MKAWFYKAEKMQLHETEIPVAGQNQLLIKVQAFGLNRADLAQKEGTYAPPPGVTDILGLEVAGTVVSAPKESKFQEGEPVFGLVQGGAYGEYVLIDEALTNRIPANLSMTEAASLAETWFTVLLNLNMIGQLKSKQRVLIHAGASGVGTTAIIYAKLCEAYVITTTRSPHKLNYMLGTGADEAWLPNQLEQQAKIIKSNGGVDLILDPIGTNTLKLNQFLLNQDGKIIIIGKMGGTYTEINIGLLLIKRQQLLGSTLRNQPLNVRAKINQIFSSEILPLFVTKQLIPHIDKVFKYTEVPEALTYLQQNRNCGKVIVSHY